MAAEQHQHVANAGEKAWDVGEEEYAVEEENVSDEYIIKEEEVSEPGGECDWLHFIMPIKRLY